MKTSLKQIFLTGLAVIVPIGLSLYVLFFLIGLMDGLLEFIPRRIHPEALLGVRIPGLGVIVTLLLIFVVGLLMKSYLGNRLVRASETLFSYIPVIRSIYDGSKKVVHSFFGSKTQSFQKVVYVQFPHPGSYVLGFVTGTMNGRMAQAVGRPCVTVFVPTTPLPTAGFLLIVPEDSLVDADMSVEEAFTCVLSCGIVHK